MGNQTPILVLVTLQYASARLIRTGADVAMKKGSPLLVLHIANKSDQDHTQPTINAEALDYLYSLSGEVGAEMCVIAAEVPVTAIANYAQKHGVRQLIMGGGQQTHGMAQTLSELLPGVQVQIVMQEDAIA